MGGSLTSLELAAVTAIAGEHQDLEVSIIEQINQSKVTARENSGSGFFTSFETESPFTKLECQTPLGENTRAEIEGLQHGMGFMLFFDQGQITTLEGFSYGEDTSNLDLKTVRFEMKTMPSN